MLFISTLKLFSFSGYLNFCLDFLVMFKKQLDQKDKVNFEIHDVTASLTNNFDTHIANIFRIKANQAMKIGQLIEYNKKNVLLQKSCRK